MKSNASSRFFDCCLINVGGFAPAWFDSGCFVWLDQRSCTHCLIVTASVSFEFPKPSVVANCVIPINMIRYYGILRLHCCLCWPRSTHNFSCALYHLPCCTVSDDVLNAVMSETLCIYVMNICIFHCSTIPIKQRHVQRQLNRKFAFPNTIITFAHTQYLHTGI